MPAGASYKRLHDLIQNVTNFQSGYPFESYHQYKFDLVKESILVIEDAEAYEGQSKHKTRKPSGLKIDAYLEEYREVRYSYDFGDDWRFLIKLEEIVEDYYFGFPTLLDGAEIAPPEDVGGLTGYYNFLRIYKDPSHSKYDEVKNWLDSRIYFDFDVEHINGLLKGISYKKTQWDKIKHKNYIIIEDKYRK